MLQLSHVISEAVLASVAIGVFFRYFSHISFYNRLLWGIFLVSIATVAIIGGCRFAGINWLAPLHVSLQAMASSVGIASAVVAVWALVNKNTVSHRLWLITLSTGMGLFAMLTVTPLAGFVSVVQSVGMLATMLVAVYGLARGYKKAIWIIVGIMSVGIATKMPLSQYISPVDLYHYALASTLLCFGRAV